MKSKVSLFIVLIMVLSLFFTGCISGLFGGKDGSKEPEKSPVAEPDLTEENPEEPVSTEATQAPDGGIDTPDVTEEPKGEPFVISLNTWIGYAPFYLAKEKGYFEGLNVKFAITDDIGAQRASFKNGEYQVTSETVDSFANGAPSGLNGKAVIKADDSCGGDGIISKKEIKTINDLKGKTIAFAQGQPSHFFLIYLLSVAGLSSADITPVYEDPDTAAESFLNGKVDAAVTWEPFLSEAASSDFGKILVTTREAEGLIVDVIVVSDKAIKERPEDVQKMVNGWFRAVEFYKLNQEEANKIMVEAMNKEVPEEFQLSPEDFDDMLTGIVFSDLPENKRYFGEDLKTSVFAEVFNTAGEIWVEEGLISEPSLPAEVYTTDFIAKVNNEQIVASVKGDTAAPTPVPAATEVAVAEPTKVPVNPTEKPKPTPAPTKAPAKPSGDVLVQLDVPPIYFDTGSAVINRNSYYVLDDLAQTLLHFKSLYLRIEGHTDDVGDEESNQILSKERAQAVANYLLKKYPEIKKERLIVIGYGESKPIASNDTEDGRDLNRRTEFYIQK